MMSLKESSALIKQKLKSHDNHTTVPGNILWHDIHNTIPFTTQTREIYSQDAILENFKDKVQFLSTKIEIDETICKDWTIIYDDHLIFEVWSHDYDARKFKGKSKLMTYGSLMLYHDDFYSTEQLLEIFKEFETTGSRRKEPHIFIITKEDGSLELKSFKIKKNKKMDLSLNYGSDFPDTFNQILKRLNKKDDKGIVVLHGTPGTGKTSLLRYLLSVIKKNVIYLPPHMTESLSDPDFITFLMDYENSILVLEDAENAIRSRDESASFSSVSNLLNISDGILGDCLKMQIIVTFNTEKTSIDKALLRPGRLIAEHEFKALSIEDSKNLIEHLKLPINVTEPMTLTQIYNHTEKDVLKKEKPRRIGF